MVIGKRLLSVARQVDEPGEASARIGSEREVRPLAALLAVEQAGVHQSLQMMGNGRLRETERLDQVTRADRVVARRDEIDDAHARRIGERSEERRARLRLFVGEGWRPQRGATVDRGNSRIDRRQYIDQLRYVKAGAA